MTSLAQVLTETEVNSILGNVFPYVFTNNGRTLYTCNVLGGVPFYTKWASNIQLVVSLVNKCIRIYVTCMYLPLCVCGLVSISVRKSYQSEMLCGGGGGGDNRLISDRLYLTNTNTNKIHSYTLLILTYTHIIGRVKAFRYNKYMHKGIGVRIRYYCERETWFYTHRL